MEKRKDASRTATKAGAGFPVKPESRDCVQNPFL